MAVQILPGNGSYDVPLEQVISLKEAGFNDWMWAYRDLDMEHVERLKESEPGAIPPIETVRVQIGAGVYHAIVDGYHRREASIQRPDAAIRVRTGNYASEEAVIDTAFQSNLKHGKAASKGTRSDYAVWIWYNAPEGQEPTMSEIARRVGLNKSTVSRAIKKAEEEEKEQEDRSGVTRVEASNAKKLATALHKFYEQERTIRGTFSDGSKPVDVHHRARALQKYLLALDEGKQVPAFRELQSLHETLGALFAMVREVPPTAQKQKTGTR